MIRRAGFLAFLIVCCFSFSVYADDTPKKRTIQVTGEAQVRVTPDKIIVRLGVITKNKKLSVAKKQNDERVKRVLKIIRGLGVKEEQIQTDYLGIEVRYKRDAYENRVPTGYLVKNTFAITLKDTSKFNRLLTNALEAGANRVFGITYHTTELRKHRDRARSMAVRHASDKATAMAGELGQKVGKPVRILEQSAARPYSSYTQSQVQYVPRQAVRVVTPTPNGGYMSHDGLALGQIAVNAGVNITFELE